MRSDLRDAFRALTRDRAFAGLAILLLALTIGVTTAVYAIVDAVLLRPLAIADQARTVVIWQQDVARNSPVVEVAYGEVDAWRTRASSFDALGVFSSVNMPLALIEGETRPRVSSVSVSAPFFAIAGTAPLLGRVFDARDEEGNEPRTVVISAGLWQRRFGGDPGVLGRPLRTQWGDDGPERSLEIVGVMPESFDFPRGTEVWLPAAPTIRAQAKPDPNNPAHRAWYLAHYSVFYAIGHLKPGATLAQAEQELTAAIRRPEADRPFGPVATASAAVTPVVDYLVGPTKPALWTLLAGAALMVLLACSSVAGLHLFRSARQDRAIAVQLAIGASPARLIRRSLIESGLLAAAGALGAVAVAWLVTRVLVAAAPVDVPRLATAAVGAPAVLVVAAGLAALACVLSGLWPALFIRHVDAGRTLTSGVRTAMHPRERLFQRVVVGSQVTFAVILLSGAALFVRSVDHLNRTFLGFDPEHLWAVEVEPALKDLERWDRFYETLMARTSQLPYVRSVGGVYRRPLRGPIGNDTIPVPKGQAGLGPDAPWRRNPRANLESVTPGYFRTLGARVLAGRDFTFEDRDAALNVVMVSASAAAAYFPGRDPIGEQVLIPTQRTPGSLDAPRWQTVVGVVDDIRYRGITMPRLDVYLPAAQSYVNVRELMVRTTGAVTPAQLAADVRALARDLDRRVHVGDIVLMRDAVANEIAPWRFAMRMLTGLGTMAAVLATVGLVGLVSLVVALRRRELGIRAALGATPGRLRAHVLMDTVRTAATATIIGVLGALALGRLVSGLLVGTPAHDPVSIAGAALLTLIAGLIGCLLPAHCAAASDPTEVLRE